MRLSASAVILVATALSLPVAGRGGALTVEVAPRFAGVPLVFDALANTNAAGQRLSVTRLDFLLSNLALRRADGAWVALPDWVAYLSPREGRRTFELRGTPPGQYDRMRFCVGLEAAVNHCNPVQYPANHPLNPEVNGLHWGWLGGYVFLALEGHWVKPDGALGGYSYHLATDQELMNVELPVVLTLPSEGELRLVLNLDQVFSKPNLIRLDESAAATHSRTNDALADQLRENMQHAFAVENVTDEHPARNAAVCPSHAAASTAQLAPGTTPLRFTMPASFPRPALPMDNPLTEEGVELGRRLFFESRLSVNNSQSCASCHDPARAFTDGRTRSIGAEGKSGTRGAMPLFNLAWKSAFFWDGRARSLREQVLLPIQNPVEMHESLASVVAKLAAAAPYPALFARAFGSTRISPDRLALALEQFLLTQVSYDAKFDRVQQGRATFTPEERRGFELFHTEYDPRRGLFGADCFHCHGGPLFQNQSFANNGLDTEFPDAGREAVTGREGDRGKFAVPSLRNVALTAPYMHDGRFRTLEEAVEHYCTGLKRSATLDPNLAKHPDGGVPLNDADKRALVVFLKTLTDERFEIKTGSLAPPAALEHDRGASHRSAGL